ncbi:endonuclease/exonuclease/phosphatase family protein [Roseovarius sp. Pro17]|uniref:endonuclease/exonuclease/phosphatase family protein n=1 Tax=Roseovarius sp. Pro17 TaxID=3108175 RepID=UPI002D78885B|nr:endonuclease/exonuclease/phosphatase family protein [Roseovarius sp. Pro17]
MITPAWGDTLRIATFNTDLDRDGPGLLLRDIARGDAQAEVVAQVVADMRADVILLQNVDYDIELRALGALRDLIADKGLRYTVMFALMPNTGMATDLDMDGDGRLGEPEDAQGHGAFAGQGGMAILSRWPVDMDGVQDLSALLWKDMPQPMLPVVDGAPFPSAQAQAALRLADVAHWAVPILHDSGPVTLLAFHASPPVFDGPEDRNGRRNHDQLRFWRHYLDGAFGDAPDARFVLLGHANQDPNRSEGIKAGIRGLLSDPRIQDVLPLRPEGEPAEATVNWPRVDPPLMRVGYVLPSRDWTVMDAGVHWPATGKAAQIAETASRHRIVWVDLKADSL